MLLQIRGRDLFPLRSVMLMYAVGSIVYTVIELLYRGHTHFSMVMLGGLCGIFLYEIDRRLPHTSLWIRSLFGAAAITALELVTGLVLNLRLRLGVWDYSDQPLHFLGQICPRFSLFWFLLCFPALILVRHLRVSLLPSLHGPLGFRTH